MKDLIESIRAQMLERLSNPFFGAFLVSWIGWNYRFLFLLFSDLPVMRRFHVIDKLYQSPWKHWGNALGWPLVTALAFVFIYPLVAKFIFRYWHRYQFDLKKLRDNIEGAALLTPEESRRTLMLAHEKQVEWDGLIKSREEELENARTDISKLQEANKSLRKSLDNYRALERPTSKVEMSSNALAIFKEICKRPEGSMSQRNLAAEFQTLKAVEFKHYFDELVRLQLVDAPYPNSLINLTPKGRATAIDLKIV